MDSHERMLAGLKEALLAERTGSEFYTLAAANTQDAQGRETFLILAAEEALHEKYLREQYGNLLAGRAPSPMVSSWGAELNADSPIFSPELKHRIATAHLEMAVLATGLALEDATITRYRTLAAETDMPELKHFFDKLTRWEEGHAAALRRQQELLLESYWHEARFAPF